MSELKESKVIVCGASYAGTLGILLKNMYPGYVSGVWASSAPLEAKVKFTGKLFHLFIRDGNSMTTSYVKTLIISDAIVFQLLLPIVDVVCREVFLFHSNNMPNLIFSRLSKLDCIFVIVFESLKTIMYLNRANVFAKNLCLIYQTAFLASSNTD